MGAFWCAGGPSSSVLLFAAGRNKKHFFYQDFFTVGNNFLEMRLSVTIAFLALLCLIVVAEGRRSRHYGRRRHRPYHRHRSYHRPRTYKTYKKTYHVVKHHHIHDYDHLDYEDYDHYHDHGRGHGYEEETVVYSGPATDLVSALGLGGIGYVASSGGALHVVG